MKEVTTSYDTHKNTNKISYFDAKFISNIPKEPQTLIRMNIARIKDKYIFILTKCNGCMIAYQ